MTTTTLQGVSAAADSSCFRIFKFAQFPRSVTMTSLSMSTSLDDSSSRRRIDALVECEYICVARLSKDDRNPDTGVRAYVVSRSMIAAVVFLLVLRQNNDCSHLLRNCLLQSMTTRLSFRSSFFDYSKSCLANRERQRRRVLILYR